MNPLSMTTFGVAAVFIWGFCAWGALQLSRQKGFSLKVWLPFAAFLAPCAFFVSLFVPRQTHVSAEQRESFLGPKTILIGAIFFVVTFAGLRASVENITLEGDRLQTLIAGLFVLASLLAGSIGAKIGRRIGFSESLLLTALAVTLFAMQPFVLERVFLFGDSPAYVAVTVFAFALIVFLALVLGGSLGFLFWGDGSANWSWGYESRIGRRFLMAKQDDGVIGAITVISVLAIAVGTTAMIVVMSVMNGFSTDLREKIFGNNAHLLVLKYGPAFEAYEQVGQDLRTMGGVLGASPFILDEVMLVSDVNRTGAMLKGIDPETLDGVNQLKENMIEGRLDDLTSVPVKHQRKEQKQNNVEASEGSMDAAIAAALKGVGDTEANVQPNVPGIVIGKEMAQILKVFVGDSVNVVSSKTELGPTGLMPRSKRFQVVGIFYSGMYEYDSKFIYVGLGAAQQLSKEGQDVVTGVEMKIEDAENVHVFARSVVSKLGGYPYHTKDWRQMNKNLFSALKLEKIAMFIILTFIILIASFLIAATLIVFVLEKSKEIAILKSMGALDTSVMKIFITYGLTVGVTGTILGLMCGLGICFALQEFAIGLDSDVYYITELPVHVDGVEVGFVVCAAVFLSYLATLYPSLMAARLNPVEGLRLE